MPSRSNPTPARRVLLFVVGSVLAALFTGLVLSSSASAAAGDFVITGRGYGQGQGFSQWGAWAADTQANATYQEILSFYYPETALASLADVAPTRQTITVRITTSQDLFANVQLTAVATAATLLDGAGATIRSVAAGESVSMICSGGKVQIVGAATTYDHVDLKPASSGGRVEVKPSDGLWSGGARQYRGYIQVRPYDNPAPVADQVYVHNILPIDDYVAGVSEIAPSWAVEGGSAFAPEAIKALDIASRTYIARHSSSVPYDDTRDINYVGYNIERSYPYLTVAARETSGQVVTYRGSLISAHYSSSSGGYTSNSAWADGSSVYEPARPDPWSLLAPLSSPGYAWSVSLSPSTLASRLAGTVNVGTITKVEVTERDTADPASHVRYLKITGSTGSATIPARTFRSLLGLKSTLILAIVREGIPVNRYQQSDSNLLYTGTWGTSYAACSGGSFRHADTPGSSCTVMFNGTYLALIAKKSPAYGKARLILDKVDQGTVDLYSATTFFGKVWETTTLEDGDHTLTIEWTGAKNAAATGHSISVDAFDIAGEIVPVPKSVLYQQSDSRLRYTGAWTNTSAAAASGGSYRRTDSLGSSVTVSFNGTSVAWLGKMSPMYGKARVSVDGAIAVVVDLYSPTERYTTVWSKSLPAGTHTVTVSWTGGKNALATGHNISVDAFRILGTILQAPAGVRYEQDVSKITYAGTWATFTTTGPSGGSYKRANVTGSSATIKFKGTYFGWVATKGTTLGKAWVSLDGGTARRIDLAATKVAYQQRVWNTGMLTPGNHTVKIWWDPANIPGKYISVDAIEVVGTLQ